MTEARSDKGMKGGKRHRMGKGVGALISPSVPLIAPSTCPLISVCFPPPGPGTHGVSCGYLGKNCWVFLPSFLTRMFVLLWVYFQHVFFSLLCCCFVYIMFVFLSPLFVFFLILIIFIDDISSLHVIIYCVVLCTICVCLSLHFFIFLN